MANYPHPEDIIQFIFDAITFNMPGRAWYVTGAIGILISVPFSFGIVLLMKLWWERGR